VTEKGRLLPVARGGSSVLNGHCRLSQMGRCFSFPTGATFVSEPAWKVANRTHWDEKVSLHLGPRGYDLTRLRAGHSRFSAIEEVDSGPSMAAASCTCNVISAPTA
jgi:hypothetical protein